MIKRDVIEQLKGAGLRLTVPRLKLVEILMGAEQPLTAEEVHARAREARVPANLSTIYRNLSTFVAMGWLDALPGPGGERQYEVHRDTEFSARVMCLDCGKLKPLTVAEIEPLNDALERSGFDPHSLRLNLSAHCTHVCPERVAGDE